MLRTWDYVKVQKPTLDALRSAIDELNVPQKRIVFFGKNEDIKQWVCIYAEYNEVGEE